MRSRALLLATIATSALKIATGSMADRVMNSGKRTGHEDTVGSVRLPLDETVLVGLAY